MLNIKKLLYKITNFFDSTKLQEKTVTGTTNAYGGISLALSSDTFIVESVRATGSGAYHIFVNSVGGTYYALVLNDAGEYSPARSLSISLKIRYRTAIVGGGTA